MSNQGDLFHAPRPAPREELATCTACGAVIVVSREDAHGVYSEYRDGEGRCYVCAMSRKRKDDA